MRGKKKMPNAIGRSGEMVGSMSQAKAKPKGKMRGKSDEAMLKGKRMPR